MFNKHQIILGCTIYVRLHRSVQLTSDYIRVNNLIRIYWSVQITSNCVGVDDLHHIYHNVQLTSNYFGVYNLHPIILECITNIRLYWSVQHTSDYIGVHNIHLIIPECTAFIWWYQCTTYIWWYQSLQLASIYIRVYNLHQIDQSVSRRLLLGVLVVLGSQLSIISWCVGVTALP